MSRMDIAISNTLCAWHVFLPQLAAWIFSTGWLIAVLMRQPSADMSIEMTTMTQPRQSISTNWTSVVVNNDEDFYALLMFSGADQKVLIPIKGDQRPRRSETLLKKSSNEKIC